ncbi:sensor histidine kinase [Sporosarcina sp. BI001-red]|uniref:sensor histidine kinase n=1 Tax=Sporosarcina sp. BI001-red TaxID=2282866 RepID=UPI001314DA04|nr:sensor histidine kinase [Sporosarcina sp. BI001-red]
MLRSKLQKKILRIVTSLIIFIMSLMLAVFVITDYLNLFERSYAISLQTAKMLSYMDTVQKGVSGDIGAEQAGDLEAIIDHYQSQVDATFIVIHDKNGRILASPEDNHVGRVQAYDDGFKAIVFGANYSMISSEILGPSVISKAPIYAANGQIIGVVTVGYLISDLRKIVYHRVEKLLYISLFILAIGILLSFWLARSIRKDIFGMEPEQIAEFYMERKAILASIDEGIIAVNREGEMTLINTAARHILGVSSSRKGDSIDTIFPNLPDVKAFQNPAVQAVELAREDKRLVVSTMPLRLNGQHRGEVITFRDKTEMTEIVNTLYEVRKYSDDLRAQAHEFTNKLYLISGLMQLGKYDEAIRTIQAEISVTDETNQFIFDYIKDAHVQAILFGKVGKASEMKVGFDVDENSSLESLPDWIGTGALTVILGNLIDNALEAVANDPNGKVSFFALDLGEDIIFEFSDNGSGINDEHMTTIFQQGFSTKEMVGRGFGLSNVERAVNALGGYVQVTSDEEGTVFAVYIPKGENRKNGGIV